MIEDHEGAERAVVQCPVRRRNRPSTGRRRAGRSGSRRRARPASPPGASGGSRYSIEPRIDMAVLDHHLIVDHAHVGHAAVGVARADIAAKQRVLLRRRTRAAAPRRQAPRFAAGSGAGRARASNSSIFTRTETQARQCLAGRPIGDRLRAAEAGLGQRVVERGRAQADEMGEDLALRRARADRGTAPAR